MRRMTLVLAMAAIAGGFIVGLHDADRASAADPAKPNVPKEATGFVGTLTATVVKPPPADNPTWFVLKVVKVLSYGPNNKVTLSTEALTAIWKDSIPALLMVKDMPALKEGDTVTVTAFQFEGHLRAAGPVVKMNAASLPAQTQPAAPTAMPEGIKTTRDIEYAKVGAKSLLLDLYTPPSPKGPLPLIVWIHGGAWEGGDKRDCPAMRLLSQGYAVSSINYRLSGEAIFPAQVEDCKGAIRFLRASAAKYNLDPNRIGVWGASAGGHLVALLGTSGNVKDLEGKVGGNVEFSSRVQCVVDYFGPTDFLQMSKFPSTIKHDEAGSPESRLVGGAIQENKDKVAKANPITYVTKDAPPFLIMHGDMDPLVPTNQSELLNDALKKAKVDVTFFVVKGAKHGFRGPELDKMVDDFLAKHLKAGAASQPADEKATH